jgi:hypothetical protein
MTRNRAATGRAAGKLISAIQREWNMEIGEAMPMPPNTPWVSRMASFQAVSQGRLEQELNDRAITNHIGAPWIKRHPAVAQAIQALEQTRARAAWQFTQAGTSKQRGLIQVSSRC